MEREQLRHAFFYDDDIFTRSAFPGVFPPCFMDYLHELLFFLLPEVNLPGVATGPARIHELRDIVYGCLPAGLPVSEQAVGTGFHSMVFRTVCPEPENHKKFSN